MATALKKELISLQRKVAYFSEQYLSCRYDLYSINGFPRDIWKKMGEEDILGINLPVEYGGLGGNSLSMVVAGETLTRRGHNMGIAVSWLIHHIVSRFLVMDLGNKRQHDMYLNKPGKG